MARKILKDDGHEETEKLLAKLEQQIAKEYKQAEKEVQDKLNDYLRRFQIKDQLKQRALAAGEITQAEYDKWRVGQIMIGQRWEEMKATLAQDFSNANQLARSTAFDHMPEVYAINHNYGTFQVEKGALVDTSYTLYDRQTVEKLLMDDAGHFIPAPGKKVSRNIAMGKDVAWNKKNVQSCMLQGILQGESIPNMATRLAKSVGEQNRKAAIRNVRTMATGVQNAGRIASYERAESMGIKLQKQWLATLDDRTRHWHRELDGQTVPTDEPFSNEIGEIMFPGDPDADPANIYNCRCTLIAALEGFERDLSDLSLRNDNHLGDMTYEEWKEEHESTSEPITRQDEISESMQNAYNNEYDSILRDTPDLEADTGDEDDKRDVGLEEQVNDYIDGISKANDVVKDVLYSAKDEFEFERSQKRNSYFDRDDGKIYLKEKADSGTVAHEVFHAIDKKNGISMSEEFSFSLAQDYKNMLVNAANQGGLEQYIRNKYPFAFREDGKIKSEYRGFSDMLHGCSGGKVFLGYGHLKEGYWEREYSVERECFSQIGRTYYENNKKAIEMLEAEFPSSISEFIMRIGGV